MGFTSWFRRVFKLLADRAVVLIVLMGCLLASIPIRTYLPSQFGTTITLVGIIVGAVMIMYQLDRQHKDNLRLQLSNHKEELKLIVHNSTVTVSS